MKLENKNVAGFFYKNKKYEIDLLLDSINNGYATYDVFDVTHDSMGEHICPLYLEFQDENDYTSTELIEIAKKEINNVKEA